MCLKLKWPEKITLLRGRFEGINYLDGRGLKDEVHKKYGNLNVFNDAVDLIDYLGITAVIDGKIFCVSGGPDPGATTLDRI